MDRPWIEAGLKYARITPHDLPAILVQRVARLRGYKNLENRFLYYLIGDYQFTHHILSVQTGTTIPHISGQQIKDFQFKLPPLEEQRAIAHILGSLDDRIELNRRMNETLEATARALFKSWFVDFDPVHAKARGEQPFGMDANTAALFPDSFESSVLGDIPRGWRVGNIYELCKVIYGAPFASSLFNTDHKGLPLIRIRDLGTHNPETYTTEQHPKATIVNPGDIIVGMDGEFRVHLWKGFPSYLNQRLCMFVPNERDFRTFLSFMLEEPMAFFEQSNVGTTVIHLGK